MSKYQTMDILKGNKIIDVHKYLHERRHSLNEFKEKFGVNQTAADEKFFNEKEYELQEQEQLFRTFAESLGMNFHTSDIHISISKKS